MLKIAARMDYYNTAIGVKYRNVGLQCRNFGVKRTVNGLKSSAHSENTRNTGGKRAEHRWKNSAIGMKEQGIGVDNGKKGEKCISIVSKSISVDACVKHHSLNLLSRSFQRTS